MKKHAFRSINVVPFIDVMLVLLAIVLTTASFISFQQMQVTLPGTEHQAPAQIQPDNLMLGIAANGDWLLQQSRITAAELRQHLQQLPEQQQIVLQVDQNAPFAAFVRLLDLFKQLGLEQRTSILSQQLESE